MKKMLLLLALILPLHSGVNGFELTFESIASGDPIRDKFSVVHFTLPDPASNNFQGGFFWLPTKQLPISNGTCSGQTHNYMQGCITYNGTSKPCSKQVRGLYYTNAKGSRLWPLDQQTLQGLRLLSSDYNNLQIDGGLYTTCGTSGSAEIYSIYGQVTYRDTSVPVASGDLGSLTAGLSYDIANNAVDTTRGLFPTLQYFNNQTPMGYIYDNVGGIGFVGGELPPTAHSGVLNTIKNDTTRNINNIFGVSPLGTILSGFGGTYTLTTGANAGIDTVWNISVLGNVLLSRGGLEVSDRQSILGNPSRSSSVVFSDVINTSDILNTLRRNADIACRGQQKITQGGPLNELYSGNPRALCIYNEEGGSRFMPNGWDEPLEIDLSDPSDYDGKEIIVKGRNVIIQGSIPNKQYALNLFVDNGNVLLRNGTFQTEVVDGGPYNTNYAVFDAKGGMVNDFYDLAPIINSLAQNAGLQNGTTYLDQQWTNRLNPVSASFVYDTINVFSGAGNTGAVKSLNYGVYLRGNIFINGILAGWSSGNNPSGLANKYYIHGRLASLNTALAPSVQRKELINTIFGDSFGGQLQNYISFSNTFGRQCLLNGFAADANGTQTLQPCQVSNDVFKLNPLVLINTGVPSKLLP